jgi:hypothetical protein
MSAVLTSRRLVDHVDEALEVVGIADPGVVAEAGSDHLQKAIDLRDAQRQSNQPALLVLSV